jgi:gas vesicle protein
MRTNGASKFSFLLIGLALGAIGGLMAALLARKETRELLRERGTKTLNYLNQEGKKLRETTEEMVQKGKELVSRRCCPGDAASAAEDQAHQEERREHLGG